MALLSWLVYVKPVNIKAMVKVCNDYYMIDALAGGEVIRKRKYRRENTMIGYKWYDYNGVEVTDPIEISRLDGLLPSINVLMRLMMIMPFSCRQQTTLTAFPVYLWISIWLSLNGDRIASKVLSPWLIMRVLTGTAII